MLLKLEALHPKPATLNPEPKPVLIDIGVLTVCFWLAIASVRRIDLPSAFQVMANLSILPVQFTLRPQQKASLTQTYVRNAIRIAHQFGFVRFAPEQAPTKIVLHACAASFRFFVVDGIA